MTTVLTTLDPGMRSVLSEEPTLEIAVAGEMDEEILYFIKTSFERFFDRVVVRSLPLPGSQGLYL